MGLSYGPAWFNAIINLSFICNRALSIVSELIGCRFPAHISSGMSAVGDPYDRATIGITARFYVVMRAPGIATPHTTNTHG